MLFCYYFLQRCRKKKKKTGATHSSEATLPLIRSQVPFAHQQAMCSVMAPLPKGIFVGLQTIDILDMQKYSNIDI